MPTEVIFPKVDMDMESGLLSEWLCANGDTVAEGQPIFVIETDKSAMEIEAAASGRIAIGEAATGDKYPVGQVMAYIYGPHESFDAVSVASNENRAETSSHSLSRTARKSHVDQALPAGNGANPSSHNGAVRASPAARRVAAEHGISLLRVNGSARQGRIVKADVIARVTSGDRIQQVAVTGISNGVANGEATETVSNAGAFSETGTVKRIRHSQMRRTIASRLTQSVQTIPSYQIVVDCLCESLLQTSHELNSGIASGLINSDFQGKVSLNVFFIKALGLALSDVSQANCQWTDTEILLFDSVDIGMAVALDDGLITPIVTSVDRKSVLEIASDIQALAERARQGSLSRPEYEGGVSTVSNLGMYGVPEFTSIVNPPQSSIVSIGAVEQCAVPVKNQLQIKSKCRATFTFDHRVIDGAVGARVASRFKETVENSVRMLL